MYQATQILSDPVVHFYHLILIIKSLHFFLKLQKLSKPLSYCLLLTLTTHILTRDLHAEPT